MDGDDNDGQQRSPTVKMESAFLVYKFLNTPQEMLVAGMARMQPTELTQFYRKLAIQLHPDKNRHPQATDAFQVVQAAMAAAKDNNLNFQAPFAHHTSGKSF